jgi:hypothetical protein
MSGNEPAVETRCGALVDFVSLNLSVGSSSQGGVTSLVERRKFRARLRHVLRFCGMYLVSFTLLAILTSPLWIILLIWWSWG